MFGLIGAALFGIVCYGAWVSADNTEKKGRQDSHDSGRDFYIDKNGRMRHTDTGRKFTTEEVHQAFNPVPLKDKQESYQKYCDMYYEPRFYCVFVNGMRHYFLSEKEALEFTKEYNNNLVVDKMSYRAKFYGGKVSIGHVKSERKEYCVFHFNYDGCVGCYQEPLDKFNLPRKRR